MRWLLVTSGLRLVLLGSNIQEASFPTQVASLSHPANPSAFGRRGFGGWKCSEIRR